ncbi:MAG: GTP-binding protein [Candidatus Woesearchaeota archaeon]
MNVTNNKQIPIAIITGFLGSGKSTFINKIIKERSDLKIGLIVNEFGDVNLESQIIETNDEDIVEMSNGCMCCVVRTDLMSAVEKLISHKKDINYIIVEASGLSDPVPLASTFIHNTLDDRIRLDAIICLIDAVNYGDNLEQYPKTLYMQVMYADFLILTKTDLVKEKRIPLLHRVLKNALPKAVIYDMNEDLDLKIILDSSTYDHSSIAELEIEEHDHKGHTHEEQTDSTQTHHNHEGHSHDKHNHYEHNHDEQNHTKENQPHQSAKNETKKELKHSCCKHNKNHKHKHTHECSHHHDHSCCSHKKQKVHHHHHEYVETLFFKTDKPFDYKKFQEFWKNLPREIVRGKGIIQFDKSSLASDNPMKDKKLVLQYVGSRELFVGKEWKPDEKKQTALVFIGKGFDIEKVRTQLKNCEA